MPLRLLCLHGWGTNVKILESQLRPLMKELRKDNSADFHFFEGDIAAEPGPGIEGVFEGPFYSYYHFPRKFTDSDESMMEAYDILYDVIEDEGPFDGVLGFSHGGTLASGFLINHAKTRPNDPPPFRCAIFLNSLPPFRMNPGGSPVVDTDLAGYISVPTVSVAGTKDFVFDYSMALHGICSNFNSQLVLHEKGHDIPGDPTNVAKMARAIRKLSVQATSAW